MNNPRLLRLMIIAAAAAALVTVSIIAYASLTKTYTVSLDIDAPDRDSINLQLDGSSVGNAKQLQTSFQARPGKHQLVVTKPYYKPQSIEFEVGRKTAVNLHAILQHIETPVLSGWDQVVNHDTLAPGAVIQQQVYFYNQTWAFLVLSAGSSQNTAPAVVKYSDQDRSWHAVLGPGTLFDKNDVQALPTDIQSYMATNQYIGI